MSQQTNPETQSPETQSPDAAPPAAGRRHAPRTGPGIDGVSGFFGMRWQDPQTARLTVRDDLINGGGLLSGVVAYALVDYTMGSTLWVQTAEHERIATISIAINYLQTATAGDVICRSLLDRRNRTTAMLRSEVHAEDGRLLVTAVGSYAIFVPRASRPAP